MRLLRFTDDAESNLVGIAVHIAAESRSREIALEFTARLRAKCRDLALLPGTLGTARPELREDIRSTPCNGYVLEVVNVLHASRDVARQFKGEA